MTRIAIVEDTEREKQHLISCLEQYKRKKNPYFEYICFENAYDFLESRERFDIAFLDIMLPRMTGMEAAQKLRAMNNDIIIIFITNMTSFAVKGYEVDALDYIVKPYTYERLEFKLTKALSMAQAKEESTVVINPMNGGIFRIGSGAICYIEVSGHKLRYCTDMGEYFENGTLRKRAENLADCNFVKCNSCYLVNMKRILAVNGYDLTMDNGDVLKISQPKKKEFMEKLANYMGQGAC